jgi:hypothetical protein
MNQVQLNNLLQTVPVIKTEYRRVTDFLSKEIVPEEQRGPWLDYAPKGLPDDTGDWYETRDLITRGAVHDVLVPTFSRAELECHVTGPFTVDESADRLVGRVVEGDYTLDDMTNTAAQLREHMAGDSPITQCVMEPRHLLKLFEKAIEWANTNDAAMELETLRRQKALLLSILRGACDAMRRGVDEIAHHGTLIESDSEYKTLHGYVDIINNTLKLYSPITTPPDILPDQSTEPATM